MRWLLPLLSSAFLWTLLIAGIHRESPRTALSAHGFLHSAIAQRFWVDGFTLPPQNPFFAGALDPERSVSARAAGELLVSLRDDWDSMQREFEILGTGDEQNFDLQRMLQTQARLVAKVERLTAALVRYASLTYGT